MKLSFIWNYILLDWCLIFQKLEFVLFFATNWGAFQEYLISTFLKDSVKSRNQIFLENIPICCKKRVQTPNVPKNIHIYWKAKMESVLLQ